MKYDYMKLFVLVLYLTGLVKVQKDLVQLILSLFISKISSQLGKLDAEPMTGT